jgi:hypothetical protein
MLELYHNNISVRAQKDRVVLAEKNLPWTSLAAYRCSFASKTVTCGFGCLFFISRAA